MAEVDPDDDTITRYVVQHYAYDRSARTPLAVRHRLQQQV